MSEHNPYAPPQAEVRDPAPEPEVGGLASRGLRLLGSIVDGILGLIVLAPLAYVTGYWQVPKLVTLLGLRYGVVGLVSLIPGVGGLFSIVDILLIFRADRRCAHDHIAGTKVVVA